MGKYIGIKVVEAVPMVVEEAVKHGLKIIHRLLYCLVVPLGLVLLVLSHILYYIIMTPVPIIIYIIKGDFNTDCIFNIEDEDHIINKIFTKINNFIYPDYK